MVPESESQPVHDVTATALALEIEGRIYEAADLYHRMTLAPTIAPEVRANSWFRLGICRHAAGDPTGALEAWNTALNSTGSSGIARRIRFHAASTLYTLGRYPECSEQLAEALRSETPGGISPAALQLKLVSSEAHLGRLAEIPVLSDSPDFDEAVAACEAAAEIARLGHVEAADVLCAAALNCPSLSAETRHHAGKLGDLLKERVALRKGQLERASIEALLAEIWHLLQNGSPDSIGKAAELCALFAGGMPQEVPLILNAIITTAFRLELSGQFQQAAALYQRALSYEQADPEDRANATLRLGVVRYAQNRGEEALALLQEAVAMTARPDFFLAASEPLLELYNHAAMWPEALDLARRVRPLVADPVSGIHWDLTIVLLRVRAADINENEDAATLLPPGALPDPSSASKWMEAAMALELSGFLSQSRAFYQAFLDAPVLPEGCRTNAHYRLGLVLDRLLDFRGAEEHLQAAIDCPDPFPIAKAEAHLRLANLHYLMDDFERALPAFEVLRETGASERARSEAQLRYGTCLFRLDRPAEARVELRRCRIPGSGRDTEYEVKADLTLAEMAEAAGDSSEAIDCYERVIRNPLSEPLTKTAALFRLNDLKKRNSRR